MFWINNGDNINNFQVEFYQIFINNKLVYDKDDNKIYSFIDENNTDENNKLILDKYKFTKLVYDIKIIDQLISFIDKDNKSYVFSIKTNFIKSQDNQFNIPIFHFSYKQVNSTKFPNLIDSQYSNSVKLEFIIYTINNDVQFIIETNLKTNIEKKYFITKNLDSIKNFL